MLVPVLLLLAAGAAAGFLGGLLGIGGGLLIVAALSLVLPAAGIPAADVMHVAVATSMATIVLTFVSSARAHARRGSVSWDSWKRLAPGLVVGGILGAKVATLLPEGHLRAVIALFCGVMAWQMAFGRRPTVEGSDGTAGARSPWLVAAGTGIGAVSAIVGIGGGSMTVPLLVSIGMRPVKAVGTSTMCGLVLALSSSLSYALALRPPGERLPAGSVGYVYLPAALVTAVASMLAAPLGVRAAHALSGKTLRRIFSVFLLAVGTLIVAGG